MPYKDPAKNAACRKRYRERTGRTPAIRRAARAWHQANPVQKTEYLKAWRAANPDAIRTYNANRRAAGRISRPDARLVADMSDGICSYCLAAPATQVEHVIPVARGGKTELANLVMACKACNYRKGKRTPLEFLMGVELCSPVL